MQARAGRDRRAARVGEPYGPDDGHDDIQAQLDKVASQGPGRGRARPLEERTRRETAAAALDPGATPATPGACCQSESALRSGTGP